MSELDDPRAFDGTARDRIRRKIMNYMVEHRIGVPLLTQRITSSNPHKPKIPIKTLQRFLAGKHRTNDMYVRFFHKFAETLPDPDPVLELGRSLADMYDVAKGADPFSDEGVARRYEVMIGQDSPHSEITVVSEGRFKRLREVGTEADYSVYDGALVGSGWNEIAVLKDRLLGLPKTYILRLSPTAGLTGRSIHIDINGNQRSHQVRFVERSDE